MQIHGNLDLLQNLLKQAVLPTETNFPAQGKPGQFCFKDKVVYACVELVSGMPAWVPMTHQIDTYIHTQSTPALEWSITHGLDSSTVIVQVYDALGNQVIPENIDCSQFNQVTVRMGTSLAGRAVLMLGTPFGAMRPHIGYTQDFSATDTVTVNHGLGYNPIVHVYIGGREVRPEDIVYDNTAQCTITFSAPVTGTVRCI